MNNKNLILIFCIYLFSGCSEFIEPSLDGKSIALLAPGDQQVSTDYQQSFWWETHDDALKYHLQIVSPKFDSIAKLIMDTIVIADKFSYTLDPGEYQWRVRPENGSSKGGFTTRSFTIFPSSIEEQQIQLSSPGMGFLTSNSNIEFNWLKLFGAKNYHLQVDDKSFTDENDLNLDVITSDLSYTQKISDEGTYQWRVRAEGETSNSKWSIVRSFTYDITPPAKVILKFPANKQIVTKPLRLLWDIVADADKYELIVYKSDSTTVIKTFPQTLKSNTLSFNLGEPGERLLWRVLAIDKSGNKGLLSDFFSFTIQ